MPFYYSSDIYYILILIPIMIFATVAQIKVKTAFNRYSKQVSQRSLTGMQAAEEVLRLNGVTGVQIEYVSGNLTDHYDPRTNTIRLSDGVYSSSSIAAVGVAAHEAGHAVQNARSYAPMRIRAALVPVVNAASSAWMLVFFMGVALNLAGMVRLAIILFSFSVIFQLVTLPVEFDASRRAVEYISGCGLGATAQKGARQVLVAAALTYVAAALVSVLQLLYLLGQSERR